MSRVDSTYSMSKVKEKEWDHLGQDVFYRPHACVLSVDQLIDNDGRIKSKLCTFNPITAVTISGGHIEWFF